MLNWVQLRYLVEKKLLCSTGKNWKYWSCSQCLFNAKTIDVTDRLCCLLVLQVKLLHVRKNALLSNKILLNSTKKILLKDPFGFSKHQEKATLGLGYKLTLEKIVNSVLSQSAATDDLKIDLKRS